jgi:hypothetical protein
MCKYSKYCILHLGGLYMAYWNFLQKTVHLEETRTFCRQKSLHKELSLAISPPIYTGGGGEVHLGPFRWEYVPPITVYFFCNVSNFKNCTIKRYSTKRCSILNLRTTYNICF